MSTQAKRPKKGKTQAAASAAATISHLSFGKDTGLALFHALGKILYNKRLDSSADEVDNRANGLPLGQGLLPATSQAMLMPCSSKECEVADRCDDVVYKLFCWHDKCPCLPTDDKHESVAIAAACIGVDKLTLPSICLSIHSVTKLYTGSLLLPVSPTTATFSEPLRFRSRIVHSPTRADKQELLCRHKHCCCCCRIACADAQTFQTALVLAHNCIQCLRT